MRATRPMWARALIVEDPCQWDDDGFRSRVCGRPEDDHCDLRGADDDCPLVHHPYMRREEADGER